MFARVVRDDRGIHADTYREVNPAAIQRAIRALTAQLLTISTSR